MSPIDKVGVAEKIRKFFQLYPQRSLFAGAGVSKYVGLPTWEEYLRYLANQANEYHPATSELMVECIDQKDYLLAAHYFKICSRIPEGIKYKVIGSPFCSQVDTRKLNSLTVLPFSCILTSNFDKVLHDAYNRLYGNNDLELNLTSLRYVELNDGTMSRAVYWTDFYIARIHGRCEIPEEMIIDSTDYSNLSRNEPYTELIKHVFKSFNCVFIGFSFFDPAIENILSIFINNNLKELMKHHLALLPDNSDPRLSKELGKANIETVFYQSDNSHKSMWEGIKIAQRELRTGNRKAGKGWKKIPSLKRFIATAYTRLSFKGTPEPLLRIVIDGIVADIIIESGNEPTSKDRIISKVQSHINLPEQEVSQVVGDSIDSLITIGFCDRDKFNKYFCLNASSSNYDNAMDHLVRNVIYRIKVREGISLPEENRDIIHSLLEELMLSRGWDLGAHFAAREGYSTFNAWDEIETFINNSLNREIDDSLSFAISNSIIDVFKKPDRKEEDLLADIGRLSFAVELVLTNSNMTKSNLSLLPEFLYLDSNFFMPLIVNGHPLGPAYQDAIERLISWGKRNQRRTELTAYEGFLEETIQHRTNAIDEVRRQGLEDSDRLNQHILRFGAANTNVFIGAYSAWVGRLGTGKSIPFSKYLGETAPYTNVPALKRYLNDMGINVIDRDVRRTIPQSFLSLVKNELRNNYIEDQAEGSRYFKEKHRVLIDNEATQLALLIINIDNGNKPIFVSADKALYAACRGTTLNKCLPAILSNIGFVQLIDLLVGVNADKAALTRLYWSLSPVTDKMTIRNYFIDLALQHYDESLAMATWEVVDKCSEMAAQAAKVEGIKFFNGDGENRARTADFMDRFQDDFFKYMAEAIENIKE